MESQIEGRFLTFYGHFTGYSSYPVVCEQIALWLIRQGVKLSIVNLRRGPVSSALASRQMSQDKPEDEHLGIGLLFGFPDWLAMIPRHRIMIGYHVGDVDPLPSSWLGPIEGRADVMMTPSVWCSKLFAGLRVTKKVHVVRHGVDPEVFRPGEAAVDDRVVVLRHYCSSPLLDRKGTIETLRAAHLLLDSLTPDDPYVIVRVSVPENVLARVASMWATQRDVGRVEVVEDQPRSPEEMADELRSVTATVQPSRAEGFGCIPLESVACGTPVVVTGVTGHAEYFKDIGEASCSVWTSRAEPCAGGYAPSIDEGSLLSAMRKAVFHREQMRLAALKASSTVREKWSWDSVLTHDMLPVLAGILAGEL